MNKILFLCLLSFHSMYCAGQAQNLVIDPGFESPRRIPQKADNSIYCTKNWSSTNGAGDYYHQDAGRHAGVPHNIFGRQKPHGGKAYGGICIRRHFIEYLETKLSEPLVKDEDYLVEYYISRAERSIGSVNEFGVIFTRRLILGSSNQGMPIKPALDFVSTKKYSNKKKWTKMSGVYRAKGDEQVVVIGYFNYDHPDGQRIFAHYYIDDVSVTLIEEKTQPLDKTEPAETVKPQDSLSSSFAPKPGERFTLKNIFFDTNKSELLPASFSELDKLVQYLKGNTHSITINGHTDNIGNENQNKELSETRAEAVADYLILKGIDASRIKYEGYGSTMPVASNDSEKGKQENRRVEIVIGSK